MDEVKAREEQYEQSLQEQTNLMTKVKAMEEKLVVGSQVLWNFDHECSFWSAWNNACFKALFHAL